MTWCSRELIRLPIYLGVSLSEADFHKKLRKMKVPPKQWPGFMKTVHANATVHYFETPGERETAIICFGSFKGRTKVEIVGLVAHEATHIWQAAMENIGEKKPSPEFEAYGIQAITQSILQEIWK
jgi:hypothetical protein